MLKISGNIDSTVITDSKGPAGKWTKIIITGSDLVVVDQPGTSPITLTEPWLGSDEERDKLADEAVTGVKFTKVELTPKTFTTPPAAPPLVDGRVAGLSRSAGHAAPCAQDRDRADHKLANRNAEGGKKY